MSRPMPETAFEDRQRGAAAEASSGAPLRPGPILLWTAGAFLLVCLPVVLEGAPLADDFHNCMEPVRSGLGSFLAASADRLGAVRPARFVEILLTTGVCQNLPFGVAIAVPLGLTLAIAAALRRLVDDLGARRPWPDIAGALWLLQPLGTESALWPAALHVPLGLLLALVALLLLHRQRLAWGAAAAVAACLSAEQVIFALPAAVWLVTPMERRRRAAVTTGAVVAGVLLAFLALPGRDPRLTVTLTDRLAGVLADLRWYVEFPAVGLGLHSVPLALRWAFPFSLALVAAGAALGWRLGPRVLGGAAVPASARQDPRRTVAAVALLTVLVNLPVVLSVPRQGSPRTFTATWLVLAGGMALAGSAIRWRLPRLTGAAAGVFAVGAVLSLALSVSVRLRTADFTRSSSAALAAMVDDGDVVAVCGIARTVVEPAPFGAFAIHELVYEWAARDALEYYTGRIAEFRLAGELWNRPCPAGEADVTVNFAELLAAEEE